MLVHFPIALWTFSVGADVVGWVTRWPPCWQIGFVALVAGLAMGAVAIVAGLLDYSDIPPAHAARDTAVLHMMVMCSVWLLFLVAAAIRGVPDGDVPSPFATMVSGVAEIALLWGGWLGGQLVYRYGVAVDK
jgi:uncharacterized membrane protein